VAICLDAAGEAGVPLDLHTDESLDPRKLTLATLADPGDTHRVSRTGVTAQPLREPRGTAAASAAKRSASRWPPPGDRGRRVAADQPVPPGTVPSGSDASRPHRHRAAARRGGDGCCGRRQPPRSFPPGRPGRRPGSGGPDGHLRAPRPGPRRWSRSVPRRAPPSPCRRCRSLPDSPPTWSRLPAADAPRRSRRGPRRAPDRVARRAGSSPHHGPLRDRRTSTSRGCLMTMTTTAPALRFSGVSKTFKDGTTALTGTHLSVSPGEFVSVVGPVRLRQGARCCASRAGLDGCHGWNGGRRRGSRGLCVPGRDPAALAQRPCQRGPVRRTRQDVHGRAEPPDRRGDRAGSA